MRRMVPYRTLGETMRVNGSHSSNGYNMMMMLAGGGGSVFRLAGRVRHAGAHYLKRKKPVILEIYLIFQRAHHTLSP